MTNVVPARYGPLRRAAATPSNSPAKLAAIIDNGIATQSESL